MVLRLFIWQALAGFVCTVLLLSLLDLPRAISVLYLAVPLAVTGVVVWVTRRKRPIAKDEWLVVAVVTLIGLAIAAFIYVSGRAALLDARRISEEAIERGEQRQRHEQALPPSPGR